jgi:hypothetical protein
MIIYKKFDMMNKKFRIFKLDGYTVTNLISLRSFDSQEEAEKYLEEIDSKGMFVILQIFEK